MKLSLLKSQEGKNTIPRPASAASTSTCPLLLLSGPCTLTTERNRAGHGDHGKVPVRFEVHRGSLQRKAQWICTKTERLLIVLSRLFASDIKKQPPRIPVTAANTSGRSRLLTLDGARNRHNLRPRRRRRFRAWLRSAASRSAGAPPDQGC